jgi:Neutral/alkaline non-lysosomal ceramidase, N-terminal
MRGLFGFAAALVALWALPGVARAEGVMAGAAVVDASWHVGASAGQYASDGTFIGDHGVNPTMESTRRAASYGIQSRLEARALVVQGPDGKRIALVKNDLYIPQDLLRRRVAQILEADNLDPAKRSGITSQTLTMTVSHDHSSPYYSSTSWGAWTFQDVFDVRFYDYYAERMALAVEKAAHAMKPSRVGASVSYLDKPQRNSMGPSVADDGTPSGYPNSDTDHDLTVVRFDDISDPKRPKPLANLVSYSLHGESLEGNDLISADWFGPVQRMLDRRTGAVTVITQNAVGTSELERSSYHDPHQRLEFPHRNYAQMDFMGHLIADTAYETWRDIAAGTPEQPDKYVPFKSSFPVQMEDRWFPGPLSHPYPSVSNCRTDKATEGDPQLPVVGLPDCEGPGSGLQALADAVGLPAPPEPLTFPIDPGVSVKDLERAGIPVPENYGAPGYTGLEEDIGIHLQAFRLGDILFTVCSCEQWSDQSRNIKTRTDTVVGNEWLGYDWSKKCDALPGGDWSCVDPRDESKRLPPVSDEKYQRMRAQVLNDAAGWNDPDYVAWAESEPADPRLIKGNYSHSELPPSQGYRLTVPISMANDYNGYIATYREYQRGDHYRKALTGWGPHSSDYLATRLVQMGGHLNGGPGAPDEPMSPKEQADNALNDARAEALGNLGSNEIQAYEALLPDDGGDASAVSQPGDVERFGAAFFTWNGGDNFTDNPFVTVERRVGSRWVEYADQSGEIPVTLAFPQGPDVPSYLSGGQHWHWTAHFEAFASSFDTGAPGGALATPVGEYRFSVRGTRREGGKPVPYSLTSASFRVSPWSGITVNSLRVEPDGRVSFAVGPRHTYDGDEIGPIDYPDSYKSPARFIKDQRSKVGGEWYCFTCSFRPWVDSGDATSAAFTFVAADGTRRRVAATEEGGRWVSASALAAGESAYVDPGAVRDLYGDVNGERSEAVTR